VGRLKNGKVFDKTDRKPFSFRLGECVDVFGGGLMG
jgi:FKBP-type peptidyl-prolyl cis-trans isomerase